MIVVSPSSQSRPLPMPTESNQPPPPASTSGAPNRSSSPHHSHPRLKSKSPSPSFPGAALPKALTPVPSVAPPSDEPAVAAAETAAKAGSPLDAGAVDSQLSKEVENGKAKSADAEGKGLSPIAPAASAVKVEEKEEGEVDEDGKDVEMKG
jgi:hypothetical protein